MDPVDIVPYIFACIVVWFVLFIIYLYTIKYLNRIRFVIRWWELFTIQSEKETYLCNASEITDIYLESWQKSRSSGMSYRLVLLEWPRILKIFSSSEFYISEPKRLLRSLKSLNYNVQFTSYNRNSFLNIFSFYRKKKRSIQADMY